MTVVLKKSHKRETEAEARARLEKEIAASLASGVTRHASYDAMARHLGLRK